MGRYRLGSAVLVTIWALASPVGAQTSPSADQIINALKPTPQALHGAATRGIRPLAPGGGGVGLP